MAIEVMKTSSYQSNVRPSPNSNVVGGSLGDDVAFDLVRNQSVSNVQTVIEQGSKDSDNKEAPASEQHIKTEISKANGRLKTHNTRCEFGYHEKTGRVTIKVMDKDTEEVIREIPPEKTLDMIEKMWELAGFLIDERR